MEVTRANIRKSDPLPYGRGSETRYGAPTVREVVGRYGRTCLVPATPG
jgi:hypothetical protein